MRYVECVGGPIDGKIWCVTKEYFDWRGEKDVVYRGTPMRFRHTYVVNPENGDQFLHMGADYITANWRPAE